MRCLIPLCALAACSAVPGDESTAPANTIEGNAGASLAPAATPVPAAASAGPAADGTPPDTSVPPADASPEGAAAVARTYHALIGERKYRPAWGLWAGGGRESGMSARDFAKSFSRYADYRAEIGAPGRIEGAAGSRYVTVPVHAYGRMQDGTAFNLRGPMTLRQSVVDGASPVQRRWQIHSSELKPRPGEPLPEAAAAPDAPARLSLRCIDGSRFVARFDRGARQVTIDAGGKMRVLRQERVPSGFRYGDGGYTLEATGETYTFTQPKQPPMPCAVNRRR